MVFFTGSAREAALHYPQNANVGAAVSIAGLGLDETRVRLISSRKVDDPLGVIEAAGAFGEFRFECLAKASPSNPKTSAITADSLLAMRAIGGRDTGVPGVGRPSIRPFDKLRTGYLARLLGMRGACAPLTPPGRWR